MAEQHEQNCFDRILAGNKTFAKRIAHHEPDLLHKCAQGQSPEILWLGCADSRIPETTVCDSKPGDLFVHRNIANIIIPEDLNSASVIEYAVTFLKVNRIMVCGHTKCGGANAAMGDDDLGPVLNTWLRPIRELRKKYQSHLNAFPCADSQANRLAELNVYNSLNTLKTNPTVVKAIAERGLTLHGVIYDIPAGELRVLNEPDKHNSITINDTPAAELHVPDTNNSMPNPAITTGELSVPNEPDKHPTTTIHNSEVTVLNEKIRVTQSSSPTIHNR